MQHVILLYSLSLSFSLSLTHNHIHTHTHPSDGSSENFVRVTSNIENTIRLTVTCEFTNQLKSSNKSCNITYGLCGQQLSEMAQGVSSSEEPNIVRVVLDLSDAATIYCFSVTASNDTFTASIDGTSIVNDATTTVVSGE